MGIYIKEKYCKHNNLTLPVPPCIAGYFARSKKEARNIIEAVRFLIVMLLLSGKN